MIFSHIEGSLNCIFFRNEYFDVQKLRYLVLRVQPAGRGHPHRQVQVRGGEGEDNLRGQVATIDRVETFKKHDKKEKII